MKTEEFNSFVTQIEESAAVLKEFQGLLNKDGLMIAGQTYTNALLDAISATTRLPGALRGSQRSRQTLE